MRHQEGAERQGDANIKVEIQSNSISESRTTSVSNSCT
jgi:hypothetical protein